MQALRRALILALFSIGLAAASSANANGGLYGLIGKIKAKPGQRDALAAILTEGTRSMPGCVSYIIAADPKDPNALWITETWINEESHKASLSLPAVKTAIQAGKPLIEGFGERVETQPITVSGMPFTTGARR